MKTGELLCLEGHKFYFGVGQERQIDKAIEFYLNSADQGCNQAMLALGNYYESINSMENAVKYYDDASAEEDGYGLYKLGEFTSNGVLDKVYKTKHDVSVAYGLFKKAIVVDPNCGEALFRIGDHFYNLYKKE